MNTRCKHCGKEIGEGELYCRQCIESLGAGSPKKFWVFAVLFSFSLLLLAGMLLWSSFWGIFDYSWDDLTGKPVAIVNGDAIQRRDLHARFSSVRKIVEQHYGENIFDGDQGKVRLMALKRQVLERIMEERLIAQECRRLGIRIGEAAVEKELQRVAGEMYGSAEGYEKRFNEDGLPPEDMKRHFRKMLMTKAVMETKFPEHAVSTPEVSFRNWLIQEKRAAQVVLYDTTLPSPGTDTASPDCCSTPGGTGGCQSQGNAVPVDRETQEKATRAALEAYTGVVDGDAAGLNITVSNYGCHIQVDIEDKGKIVKSYSYRDGQVFEI